MKKVLIFGTFDILHPGHLFLIQQAQKEGKVTVCLARDETIAKVKGQKPYYPLTQRQKNLEALGLKVCPGSLGDKYEVFRQVNPEVVILGYDQKFYVDGLQEVIRNEGFAIKILRLPAFKEILFKSSRLRLLFEDQDSGFLLINKPVGEPSFRTVSELRRITGQKKIGFAGTLDPAASGLLVLGINQATKFLDVWHIWPKEYLAEITLGQVSSTYDREGTLTTPYPSLERRGEFESGGQSLSPESIRKATERFIGVIQQIPPMHSAKSIDGKRLYELAREGKEVERQAAQVTIYKLELIDYHYPVLKLKVLCSTGTYIRSLAHDLGQVLKVGAYLSALERMAVGPYRVEQAVTVNNLTTETWRNHLVDLEQWKNFILTNQNPAS